jgi:hypothetical protein
MRAAVPQLRQYVFMVWCLIKHRDKFALIFYFYRVGKTYGGDELKLHAFVNRKYEI